ncbi:LOW QUALITY PROTEIN: uncharacterized protein [Drosophila takahashii]|uniref:LOW QUALITY PROTEIN: uncharacterized protein n=1 Tax=Drosophila takahashii TaxID=29030 RepID=UPI0038991066
MWENRRHLSVHAHLEQPSFPTHKIKVLKHNEPRHTITIVADLDEILSSPESGLCMLIVRCVKLNEHSSAQGSDKSPKGAKELRKLLKNKHTLRYWDTQIANS